MDSSCPRQGFCLNINRQTGQHQTLTQYNTNDIMLSKISIFTFKLVLYLWQLFKRNYIKLLQSTFTVLSIIYRQGLKGVYSKETSLSFVTRITS